EWHPGELYPRVGFIVTNMSRPAERVVAFYNKRGTCEQWIKEGKGAIKWTRLSCRTFAAKRGAAPASCTRLQPRQFPAHAGDAGADQGLVADDLEGQADQDRREGGEPRPLCYLPDGRGRHRTANVPGDFAADRGATAAATTSASMRRSMDMRSRATDRRSASKCQGKWPDQTLDQALGLPEVLVAVGTSRLSCKRAGKTRTLMPLWDSSGESRFMSPTLSRI